MGLRGNRSRLRVRLMGNGCLPVNIGRVPPDHFRCRLNVHLLLLLKRMIRCCRGVVVEHVIRRRRSRVIRLHDRGFGHADFSRLNLRPDSLTFLLGVFGHTQRGLVIVDLHAHLSPGPR